MKSPGSFKQSLILHFLAVAVLPILLLGFFGNRYFEQAHLETVTDLFDIHALNVSRESTKFLYEVDAKGRSPLTCVL